MLLRLPLTSPIRRVSTDVGFSTFVLEIDLRLVEWRMKQVVGVMLDLFLDDLRARLEEAGDNSRMLLNLRRRMSRIRVFDPACGSGNFLVIAYKEIRAIEDGINKRRGEADRRSDIPLTNFRGIELRDFPAEIARLALVIAEYQCDVLYRGEKLALAEFLPLSAENWITCGNALRLDWLSVCPPTGTHLQHVRDAGIVQAERASLLALCDRLDHRPEDVRVDLPPVETADMEQVGAGDPSEARRVQAAGKKPAIYIGKHVGPRP